MLDCLFEHQYHVSFYSDFYQVETHVFAFLDVAAGTIGLLDVCLRVGKYLYSLKNSVADIEKDLTGLQKEVDSIRSIHSSLERICLAHHNLYLEDLDPIQFRPQTCGICRQESQ